MLCPRCTQQIADGSPRCPCCGSVLAGPQAPANPYGEGGLYAPQHSYGYGTQQSLGDDTALRFLIPVGRSAWAIAAGYLGLLSLAICPLGPFAVIAGIIAIINIQRDPKLHGLPRAIIGIVLGLVGSLGLCAGLAALVGGGFK